MCELDINSVAMATLQSTEEFLRDACCPVCIFNMDHMIKEWQKPDPEGISMDKQQEINTVLL